MTTIASLYISDSYNYISMPLLSLRTSEPTILFSSNLVILGLAMERNKRNRQPRLAPLENVPTVATHVVWGTETAGIRGYDFVLLRTKSKCGERLPNRRGLVGDLYWEHSPGSPTLATSSATIDETVHVGVSESRPSERHHQHYRLEPHRPATLAHGNTHQWETFRLKRQNTMM